MFQSTHSLRSATGDLIEETLWDWFQSTHSLRSATFNALNLSRKRKGFNPRTPCGVRLLALYAKGDMLPVSIHALLAECDRWKCSG